MKRLLVWFLVAGIVVMVLRIVWPLLIAAAVAWLVWHRIEARRAERRALLARADQQHAQIMAGNPAGMYGLYGVPEWALPKQEVMP